MNLEDNVCSLELAKKLKELGVNTEPYFWWIDGNIIGNSEFLNMSPSEKLLLFSNTVELYPAFTSDELFDLLPAWIDTKQNEPFNIFYLFLQKRTTENIRYIAKYVCDTFSAEEIEHPIISFKSLIKTHSPKLADCLAELLILVKEQGLG